jgi:DNA-binding HxlR family transcriptional regulator
VPAEGGSAAAAWGGVASEPNPRADALREALGEICPVQEVIDRVSGKWSVGILVAAAAQGPIRFTELERAVDGISRRMLTLTLRNLERDGLLLRTVYPTVPPKVEYTATNLALELYEHLAGLTDWARRHRAEITAARVVYDRRAPSAAGSAGAAAGGAAGPSVPAARAGRAVANQRTQRR